MKTRMLLTAGAVLLLGACSRGNSGNIAGVETNAETGITTTPQGIQLNSISAVGGCLSPEDQRRPTSDFTPEQRRQIVACFNAAAAQQVNAQLPKQIDPVTRLDRIAADGALLTYHYTILRPASSLPAAGIEQIKTQTRRLVCVQPQMRQTLELGGSFAYRWVDNQGAPLGDLRIDAC